jgi:hypothetical protein
MSFFDSEMVQEEMNTIAKIQKKIVKELPSFFIMDTNEKLEHINLLSELLEKQQILYTRLTLSDDPDALRLKEQMIESAKILGFGPNPDVNVVFKSMQKTIDSLRKTALKGR